jgi:lysozyme
MHMGSKGLELLKHFEQFKGEAYQDSVGVWTIGYGRIKNVKPGDTCTLQEAEDWLAEELEDEYEGYVRKYVTVDLTQDQFDALVCWTYNLGGGALQSSTLLKRLNAGLYHEVPAQMKRWNKAGGKVLRGLTRRRFSEAHLWATGEVDFHPEGWDD